MNCQEATYEELRETLRVTLEEILALNREDRQNREERMTLSERDIETLSVEERLSLIERV